MRGRLVAAAAAILAALGACSGTDYGATHRDPPPETSGPAERKATPGGGKPGEREMRERSPTRPRSVPVENLALNRADRGAVERAVRDLKDLGFWRRLTSEVESVIVATRPGPGGVPEDGHLADAVRNVRLGRHAGYTCDVMIFSHALKRDVARQRSYYEQGRLPHPAPSLREFWAVILAHELAHCTDRGERGERYSTIWERRVLAAFGAARLGS